MRGSFPRVSWSHLPSFASSFISRAKLKSLIHPHEKTCGEENLLFPYSPPTPTLLLGLTQQVTDCGKHWWRANVWVGRKDFLVVLPGCLCTCLALGDRHTHKMAEFHSFLIRVDRGIKQFRFKTVLSGGGLKIFSEIITDL